MPLCDFSYWTDQASEIYDGGDTTVYVLAAQQVANDLANQRDKNSQALALAQAIGILGSLGTGIPGDACAAAEVSRPLDKESGTMGHSILDKEAKLLL